MRLTKQITTERLTLRPFRLRDAADLYAYAKDEQVGPNAGWPPHRSVSESRRALRDSLIREGNWAITLTGEDVAIGSIGLRSTSVSRADIHKKALEIGFSLARDKWGNGYIPEAAKAVLHYGFSRYDLDLVWCVYYDFNDRSRRVCEKIGFVYDRDKPSTLDDLDGRAVTEKLTCLTRRRFYELYPNIDRQVVLGK